MSFLNDSIRDNGLQYFTDNGDRQDICNAEPSNFTEATSTFSLGNKTGLTVGSPQAGDVSGRKVVVPAVTDGDVTATDTATHWALSKTPATSELLAAQTLNAPQAVTSGNTYELPAYDIEHPDQP